MLNGIIEGERRGATERILRHYRQRYLSHASLLPSARFGLYAVAKELLAPGDRVIISPITCRTVIYALMAAGVEPVFVDIELATGNIDATRIPTSLLDAVRAIVTTNLYGNPDCALELKRQATSRGVLLIEDCAHVLHSSVAGREIGSLGDASVFSFKKFFGEPGGILTVRSEAAARRIEERIAAETTSPSPAEEHLRYIRHRLGGAIPSEVVSWISRIGDRRRESRIGSKRAGSPLGGNTNALQSRFLPQPLPTTAGLMRVADLLCRLDRFISDRMAAIRELIAGCPLPMKKSGYAEDVCYLSVPFFSPNRDTIIRALKARGISTFFLYTPPMNVVFRKLLHSNYRVNTDVIETWCRNILPIDPRFRRDFLEVIRSTS